MDGRRWMENDRKKERTSTKTRARHLQLEEGAAHGKQRQPSFTQWTDASGISTGCTCPGSPDNYWPAKPQGHPTRKDLGSQTSDRERQREGTTLQLPVDADSLRSDDQQITSHRTQGRRPEAISSDPMHRENPGRLVTPPPSQDRHLPDNRLPGSVSPRDGSSFSTHSPTCLYVPDMPSWQGGLVT